MHAARGTPQLVDGAVRGLTVAGFTTAAFYDALADALTQKFGGDSVDQMKAGMEAYLEGIGRRWQKQ